MFGKLARALRVKQDRAVTIGFLIERNQRLVIHCKACGVIAYVKPSSIAMKPNVELKALEEFQSCSECGYYNSSDGRRLLNVWHDGNEEQY